MNNSQRKKLGHLTDLMVNHNQAEEVKLLIILLEKSGSVYQDQQHEPAYDELLFQKHLLKMARLLQKICMNMFSLQVLQASFLTQFTCTVKEISLNQLSGEILLQEEEILHNLPTSYGREKIFHKQGPGLCQTFCRSFCA